MCTYKLYMWLAMGEGEKLICHTQWHNGDCVPRYMQRKIHFETWVFKLVRAQIVRYICENNWKWVWASPLPWINEIFTTYKIRFSFQTQNHWYDVVYGSCVSTYVCIYIHSSIHVHLLYTHQGLTPYVIYMCAYMCMQCLCMHVHLAKKKTS